MEKFINFEKYNPKKLEFGFGLGVVVGSGTASRTGGPSGEPSACCRRSSCTVSITTSNKLVNRELIIRSADHTSLIMGT